MPSSWKPPTTELPSNGGELTIKKNTKEKFMKRYFTLSMLAYEEEFSTRVIEDFLYKQLLRTSSS